MQPSHVKPTNTRLITDIYHMRGKITECWLAETEGIFLNHEGSFGNQEGRLLEADWLSTPPIKLVSHFKRILKRNFRNASLLSLILTWLFYLNMKENPHATKRSLKVEKQKDFSENALIHSLKKVWMGTAGVARSIELQNFTAAKLKVNFFVSLRVTLLVLQVTLWA